MAKNSTKETRKAATGGTQARKFKQLEDQLQELREHLLKLQDANAMQYSVDSGVEQLANLNAQAEFLRRMMPECCEKISNSLETIACRMPAGPVPLELNEKQYKILHAIDRAHPALDFGKPMEVDNHCAPTTLSAEYSGEPT